MITKEDAIRFAQESAIEQQAAIAINLTEAIKLAAQRGEYSAVVYCPQVMADTYLSVAQEAGYTTNMVVGTDIPGRETDTNTLTVSWD